MTNKLYGTLYIGVTSDLPKRIYQHRTHAVEGFTSTYNLTTLVYYELHDTAETAIRREKRLKEWPRQWKLDLVNSLNPDWTDLFEEICA